MSKIYDALKRAERERELAREQGRDGRRPLGEEVSSNGRDHDDYRRIRASLLFTPAYADLHTILVTASRHGEGTTRVAVGLASALASEGETRVLLVEANFRTPSLAKQLPLGRGPGLAEFLAGHAGVETVTCPVPDLNLSAVHAGAAPSVVDCEAVAAAISRLAAQFDFVIVDAPPVNRYADVSVLAPKADGVILVVEADQTPVADAEAAKRNLDRVGARIFGVVLNRRRSYVPAALQALL